MGTLNTFFSTMSQKSKYGELLKLWAYDYETVSPTPARTLGYEIGALADQSQIDSVKKFVLDLARGSHDGGFYGLYISIYGTNPSRLLGQLWFSEIQTL